jgi:hypothetical protein
LTGLTVIAVCYQWLGTMASRVCLLLGKYGLGSLTRLVYRFLCSTICVWGNRTRSHSMLLQATKLCFHPLCCGSFVLRYSAAGAGLLDQHGNHPIYRTRCSARWHLGADCCCGHLVSCAHHVVPSRVLLAVCHPVCHPVCHLMVRLMKPLQAVFCGFWGHWLLSRKARPQKQEAATALACGLQLPAASLAPVALWCGEGGMSFPKALEVLQVCQSIGQRVQCCGRSWRVWGAVAHVAINSGWLALLSAAVLWGVPGSKPIAFAQMAARPPPAYAVTT